MMGGMSIPDEIIIRQKVLLSIQCAMLGEVFPSLRAVSVDWDYYGSLSVHIYAYVDAELSDDDRECLSQIETEVDADQDWAKSIGTEVIRLSPNERVPRAKPKGVWVFMRKD
jgi:hypothetical protein